MKIMDVHAKEQICQYEEIFDKILGVLQRPKNSLTDFKLSLYLSGFTEE